MKALPAAAGRTHQHALAMLAIGSMLSVPSPVPGSGGRRADPHTTESKRRLNEERKRKKLERQRRRQGRGR